MHPSPGRSDTSNALTGARGRQKPNLAGLVVCAIVGLLVGALGALVANEGSRAELFALLEERNNRQEGGDRSVDPGPESMPEPEPLPESSSFYVAAGGDVLLHTPVHYSARTPDGYDFNPLLEEIDHLVQGAAVALCHLEVPLLSDGETITGYPEFGASRQIAFDLETRGWDGCSTASNHSIDKGYAGVESTIEALQESGLGFDGTATSEEQHDEIQMYTVELDGFSTTIAHLSYTRGLNGLMMPTGKPWAVNLIEPETIIERSKAARELGADLVFVSVHDGVEYTPVPSAGQVEVAKVLAQSKAVDLFIGHHPHVPQPIGKLEGGPGGEGMWVAYSLGNFISNQDSDCCVEQTSNGLMLFPLIENDRGVPPRLADVQWRALTVDREGGHKVYDLSALHSLSEGVGTLSAQEVDARFNQVREVMGTQASELVDLPGFAGTLTTSRADGSQVIQKMRDQMPLTPNN